MGRKFVLLGDMGLDHEGYPPTPVIAGSSTVLMDGKPIARVGDPLAIHSKPHHPPHPRAVAAGEPTILIEGKPVALTGHPVDCGGTLVGSGSGEVNGMGGGAMMASASFNPGAGAGGSDQAVGRNASAAAVAGSSLPASAGASGAAAGATSENAPKASGDASGNTPSAQGHSKAPSAEESVSPAVKADKNPDQKAAANDTPSEKAEAEASKEPQEQSPEPGFHIVREPMSKTELLQNLYGDASAKPDHFDRLNPNIGSRVLPSEMIVLGDPEGMECTQEEADLMRVASQVNEQVHTLDESEAQFLADHYDLLEMLTSDAITGMSAGAVMISKQVAGIEAILHKLETLHQETYSKYGHLNNTEFFEKRRSLFKQLDFALGSIARKGMSLDDNPKLKSALGLSSKSIVHHWKQSGVGKIPGYATHYSKLAAGTRYVKIGGFLVVGADATLTEMHIKEVCRAGSREECTKVKYTQRSRVVGSAAGGSAGAAMGGAVCVGLGVTTGIGGVVCAIILGGIGSAVGGSAGGGLGESGGEILYEGVYDD